MASMNRGSSAGERLAAIACKSFCSSAELMARPTSCRSGNFLLERLGSQVVGRGREGEGPTNPGDSTMTSLAQASDRLEPAKNLFHSFASPLAEQVAGVARAASVDRAVDLLRDVRCDSILPQCAHQLLLIITFVGAQRDPTLARDLCRHRQSRRGLGDAAGQSQARSGSR